MLRRRPRRTGRHSRPSHHERPDRSAPHEIRITFDEVLRDLDPRWLAIDWSEVQP